MPQLTLKETITRKIDISTDTLCEIIEQLSELERKNILIKLKSKPAALKTFKKDKVKSIIADFAELNIYENDFLKDLEEGLKKTSLYRLK
ncbi:MAG: hypothetical protein Q8N95_05520 [Desulfobacterales bacterium]|jgi:hypothetical protein|nr:hypothetical protein [Desulfobacterales bacterium]